MNPSSVWSMLTPAYLKKQTSIRSPSLPPTTLSPLATFTKAWHTNLLSRHKLQGSVGSKVQQGICLQGLQNGPTAATLESCWEMHGNRGAGSWLKWCSLFLVSGAPWLEYWPLNILGQVLSPQPIERKELWNLEDRTQGRCRTLRNHGEEMRSWQKAACNQSSLGAGHWVDSHLNQQRARFA